MESFEQIILLAKFASTFAMVGLIWFVQIVHYPLFAEVGHSEFRRYEMDHQRLTSWVVIPPMLTELATTLLLLWMAPEPLSVSLLWISAGLLATIWLVTFFIQVPQHTTLLLSYDRNVIRSLVGGNWIRTLAWSLRGLLVCILMTQALTS